MSKDVDCGSPWTVTFDLYLSHSVNSYNVSVKEPSEEVARGVGF